MRKYLLVPKSQYDEFLASIAEPPLMGNVKAAQERTAELVEKAQDDDPNADPSYVILEEAGSLNPIVKKRVEINFSTSRTVTRRDPAVIAKEKAEKAAKAAQGPQKRGRKPKNPKH